MCRCVINIHCFSVFTGYQAARSWDWLSQLCCQRRDPGMLSMQHPEGKGGGNRPKTENSSGGNSRAERGICSYIFDKAASGGYNAGRTVKLNINLEMRCLCAEGFCSEDYRIICRDNG